ncbi:Conserved secreted protein [Archaeoglobus sulfaticallidus PM70-1]|uniref:Conserved secreted protein n=1 Tax=Archaeoglobus sulfaticallidus PM70-1 TaxID=387631 RepID=N0BJS8_9EURY|nr:LEA type 2 family protein [Archaeoglobus sulfaticallidus]AGK60395.1 Conserved secreted protein [Archaeoglobus sulfaticallidus PM70-1]
MKKLAVLIIIGFIIAGCSQVKLGKPEIRSIENHWGGIHEDYSEVITNIKVYNPNPVPIPLKDVETKIYMNSIEMGHGSALKSEIAANTESTIELSTKIDNSKIPEWWVSHIKNGEKSTMLFEGDLVFDLKVTEFKYPIKLTRTVETNILSGFKLDKPEEIRFNGIKVRILSLDTRWGEVTKDYTEIIATAEIESNLKVMLEKISYTIEMNGIKVGEGESNILQEVGGKTKVEFITKIDNNKLTEWWISHLKNGERTEVRLNAKGIVSVHDEKEEITLIDQVIAFQTNFG